MRMSLLVFMFFFSLQPRLVSANEADDFLSALQDSGWGEEYESTPQTSIPNEGTNANTDVVVTSSRRSQAVCTRSEQTTLPQATFNFLLSKKRLDPSHSPNSGTLTLDGGMMVANCNEMLNYNFSTPTNERPYIYQVEIRKPATGCEEDPETGKVLCEYKAYEAVDGIPQDEKKTVKVEPNYYGFIQCLKDVGVFDGKKIVKDKVAPIRFTETYTGAHSTDNFWYYCKGPECPKQSLQKKSNAEENSCRHYENIKGRNGKAFKMYSQADVDYNNLRADFKTICASGDYRLIQNALPKFAEFESMYKILKAIRNELLEDEVKMLHKRLESKNYSKLSSTGSKQILKDFYEQVIKPKQDRILEQVNIIDSLPEGPQRKNAKEYLGKMVNDFKKYAKPPYVTGSAKGDYGKMQDFARKAPLHEEDWREAALQAYLISNSAYHMSRYHPSSKLEFVETAEIYNLIRDDFSVQQEKMDKIGVLANDKDGEVSFARSYKQAADDILIGHRNTIAGFNEELQMERQFMQQNCYNPRFYWITGNQTNQNACVQQSMYFQQQIMGDMAYAQSPEYMSNIYSQVQGTMGMSSQWAAIEAARNKAYGINPRSVASNLSADPRAYRTPTYSDMMSQQFDRSQGQFPLNGIDNSYAAYLQQQALMRSQQMGWQQQGWGPQQSWANPNANYQFQSNLNWGQ